MNLLYFSIVGLVIAFAGHPLLRPLRDPSLCYLGTISYGIYLYHLPLFALISPRHFTNLCNDPIWLDAFKLAATFALAVVSWQFIEKPILRLKDRFPYPSPGHVDEAESHDHPPRPHRRPQPWRGLNQVRLHSTGQEQPLIPSVLSGFEIPRNPEFPLTAWPDAS